MQKNIKYILVTIFVLLIILFFLKYSNALNNGEGFYTNGNILNKIKPGCDPTHPLRHPTKDSNNCDCSGRHLNEYALYNSNDDRLYDSIVKCKYVEDKKKSEWTKVTNEIRYNSDSYKKCNNTPHQNAGNVYRNIRNMFQHNNNRRNTPHQNEPNRTGIEYACQPQNNSKTFALWNGNKWITGKKINNVSYYDNAKEYEWINEKENSSTISNNLAQGLNNIVIAP